MEAAVPYDAGGRTHQGTSGLVVKDNTLQRNAVLSAVPWNTHTLEQLWFSNPPCTAIRMFYGVAAIGRTERIPGN
jgi:hypothetical protein